MSPASAGPSLGEFLEHEVYPRLTPEVIYRRSGLLLEI